jgi:hypothetical protein
MLTFVVVLNVLISLICLYVAWQVWNLRRALRATADAVLLAERNTYKLLHGAPEAISQGQVGIAGARDGYQQLELQLQKFQQILMLLSLIQKVWGLSRRSVILPRGDAKSDREASQERSPKVRLQRSGRKKRRQR